MERQLPFEFAHLFCADAHHINLQFAGLQIQKILTAVVLCRKQNHVGIVMLRQNDRFGNGRILGAIRSDKGEMTAHVMHVRNAPLVSIQSDKDRKHSARVAIAYVALQVTVI